MVEYSCPRCGYTTRCITNYKTHLKRKYLCPPTKDDLTLDQLIEHFNHMIRKTTEYKCDYCVKTFKTPQGKYQHKQRCKSKPIITQNASKDRMEAMIEKLLDKVTQLEHKVEQNTNTVTTSNTNNGIVNNTTNITMNVQLREFGHENMAAIPPDFINGCFLKNLDVRDLLENLHFDPNYPENHNVRLISKKQEIMEFYKNKKWYPMSLPRGLNDLIQHACRIFREYYNENRDGVKEDVGEEEMIKLLDQLEELDKLNERLIKPVKSEITAMLIGGKKYSPYIECSTYEFRP